MIINVKDNQIALFIKNAQGAKLPIDAKVKDAAIFWIRGISF